MINGSVQQSFAGEFQDTSDFWRKNRARLDRLKNLAENQKSLNTNHLNNSSSLSKNILSIDTVSSSEDPKFKLFKREEEKISRRDLYADPAYRQALDWGVAEWLIHVCVRDYGRNKVRGEIFRISKYPDGYFKPQYGPVNQQRGKIFNVEMRKLKNAK